MLVWESKPKYSTLEHLVEVVKRPPGVKSVGRMNKKRRKRKGMREKDEGDKRRRKIILKEEKEEEGDGPG